MEGADFDLWSSGVWLIPLVLAATLAGLYWLVYSWKTATESALKKLRSEMRRFGSGRREINQRTADFTPQDPEPFGSRMTEQVKYLEELDRAANELELAHVQLLERTRWLAADRWRATFGALYFWSQARREVNGLSKEMATLHTGLQAAMQLSDRVVDAALDVARDVARTRQLLHTTLELVDHLEDKHVGGEAMERATAQVEKAEDMLSFIPSTFLEGGDESVLRDANKGDVARAQAIITDVRPELERLATLLQGWQRQYQQSVHRVRSVTDVLAALDNDVDKAPAALNLTALKTRLEQVRVIARTLQNTADQFDASSLGEVIEQSARTQRAIQEMHGQLKSAQQALGQMEKELPDLNASLKVLSTQFAALSASSVHPVVWSRSRTVLTALSRQASNLGSPNRPRTPEQLEQDLATVQRLSSQQKELSASFNKTAGQHAELLRLLDTPELREGRTWCANALRQVESMLVYHPDNWSRQEPVGDLRSELEGLVSNLQAAAGNNPAEPVDEAEVASQLEQVQTAAQRFVRARERLDRANKRLGELRQTEEVAGQALGQAVTSLNQIQHLAHSNGFLFEIAGQELERLQGLLLSTQHELEQHQAGLVDRKARQVEAGINKAEAAAANWLEKLTSDIREGVKFIAAGLGKLEEIAPLDEAAINQARRLLAESQGFSGGAPRARMDLTEAVSELKRRSDHWQALEAASKALDELQGEVSDSYAQAFEIRQTARQNVHELSTWLRNTRGWPPTSISISAEQVELDRLEQEWNALKKEPIRALVLVRLLGDLSRRYGVIAEKAHSSAGRIQNEYDEITRLENEINELVGTWGERQQDYRDSQAAVSAIREIMDRARRELQSIKQHAQRGTKNYGQVVQSLQMLQRNVRLSSAAIDDERFINIEGREVR